MDETVQDIALTFIQLKSQTNFSRSLCKILQEASIDTNSISRGGGTGGAGGALEPPIFLQIGKILLFSTPNISKSKEGDTKKSLAPPIFYTFHHPC